MFLKRSRRRKGEEVYESWSLVESVRTAVGPRQRAVATLGKLPGAQLCIGLVVTPEGLPLAYEVFEGNRADVTTVEEIVETMREKYGQERRVWVLDRGRSKRRPRTRLGRPAQMRQTIEGPSIER